jgi:hypothetical protein
VRAFQNRPLNGRSFEPALPDAFDDFWFGDAVLAAGFAGASVSTGAALVGGEGAASIAGVGGAGDVLAIGAGVSTETIGSTAGAGGVCVLRITKTATSAIPEIRKSPPTNAAIRMTALDFPDG